MKKKSRKRIRLLHGGSLGIPDLLSSGITDVIIGMRLLIRMCRGVEDVQNWMKDRAAAGSEELEHQPAVWLKQKRRTKTRTLSHHILFSERTGWRSLVHWSQTRIYLTVNKSVRPHRTQKENHNTEALPTLLELAPTTTPKSTFATIKFLFCLLFISFRIFFFSNAKVAKHNTVWTLLFQKSIH